MGQFALDEGVIDGEHHLPKGWMDESVIPTDVDELGDENYGLSWRPNAQVDGSLHAPDLPTDTYWASGHDGQRVYVVP